MEHYEKDESKNLFLSFAKPYYDFIGKGKIYSLVYVVMAGLNLLLPLGVIFFVIESGFLQNSGAGIIIAFIFAWLVLGFASWMGFQLWWYRKSFIKKIGNAEIIATPVISDLIQTFGECCGTFSFIVGVGVGIIVTVFYLVSPDVFNSIGLTFNVGPLMIVGGPLAGFIFIIVFRFIAEQIKLFSSLVNNTREIAKKK